MYEDLRILATGDLSCCRGSVCGYLEREYFGKDVEGIR